MYVCDIDRDGKATSVVVFLLFLASTNRRVVLTRTRLVIEQIKTCES